MIVLLAVSSDNYRSAYFQDGSIHFFMEMPDWKPKAVSHQETMAAFGAGKFQRIRENTFFANVEKLRLALQHTVARALATKHGNTQRVAGK